MLKETTIELRNEKSELVRLHQALREFVSEHDIGDKLLFHLELVCDELITNTISYGFPDQGPHTISVSLFYDAGEIGMTIIDDGIAFNPLERQTPDITLSAEERGIGGLGIYLVKQVMDKVVYARTNGQNQLRLSKKIYF